MCFPFHPLRRCSLFAPDSSSSNVFNKLWILAPPCHCFRPLGTPRHDVKFKCLSLGLAFKAFLHTWEKEAFNYVCDVAGATSLPMHSAQLIMFVISNLAVCATTKLQSCSCIFSESNEDFADLSRAYNIKISKIIPDFFLKAKIVLPWCLSIFWCGAWLRTLCAVRYRAPLIYWENISLKELFISLYSTQTYKALGK